jgi:FixJ family two-component response regulator
MFGKAPTKHALKRSSTTAASAFQPYERVNAKPNQVASLKVNKQIASELNLSIKTVGNHRQELMRRLNIHHVAGLTRYAISNGVIAVTSSVNP